MNLFTRNPCLALGELNQIVHDPGQEKREQQQLRFPLWGCVKMGASQSFVYFTFFHF